MRGGPKQNRSAVTSGGWSRTKESARSQAAGETSHKLKDLAKEKPRFSSLALQNTEAGEN